MRIVAGSAKGVRLGAVPKGVRPASDVAREGLFSSLGSIVPGARVLDLFAGTGALGIEAISRGADHAVFVERSRAAIRAIRENLVRTKLSDRAEVVREEVRRFVIRDANPFGRFDLIVADPPYEVGGEELEGVLNGVAEHLLAAGDWRVALTRRTGSSTPVIPVQWAPVRRLEYGDTWVFIFREA